MSRPLISVVMPAYNHQAYVAEAIDSVLNQTWRELELVIVDDASSDATWEIIDSYADERIRASRHESNQGAHVSLNEALQAARGNFIAIINSDDVFHPERLQCLVEAAWQTDRDDFFAFSDISFIDQKGRFVPEDPRARDYWNLTRICGAQSGQYWFFTGNPAVTTSNFFFSRSLLDKVGAFAALRYTHDWDWALRATVEVAPLWVRKHLLRYRVHPANTLAEGDVWRHVHENTYVQATALQRGSRGRGSVVPDTAARGLCLALLRNESLHPLSLCCFLLYYLKGADEAAVLALAQGDQGDWVLPDLARDAALPADIFLSLPQWVEKERVIAAQAALIEARWQAIEGMNREVAQRDVWIADLRARLDESARAIAVQADLVEERWHAIEHMSQEIASRDAWIADLQVRLEASERAREEIPVLRTLLAARSSELAALENELAARESELAARQNELAARENELADRRNELAGLYADRFVRAALFIRRLWAGLRRRLTR